MTTLTNFNHLIEQLLGDVDKPLTESSLDALKILESFATPGPWVLATSNSYRRISTERGDGDVLHAGRPARDGVTDLAGNNVHPDLMYIIAARTLLPRAILTIRQMGLDMHAIGESGAAMLHSATRIGEAEARRLGAELKAVRDELADREREAENLRKANDRAESNERSLHAENIELREQMLFLRDEWSAVTARATGCPLCVYEDGVFVRACRPHEQVRNAIASRNAVAMEIAAHLDEAANQESLASIAGALGRVSAGVRAKWGGDRDEF